MWKVETLNAIVTAEVNALPDDMLARLRRVGELIQTHGIERVRTWPILKVAFGKCGLTDGMELVERSM